MVDEKYLKYAKDVVEGKIVAGTLIKQTCQRYLSWFEKDDRYFNAEKADKPVRFISHLRHSTGKFVGKQFILQDWQEFLVYAVFGWYWKDSDTRVVRNAYIQIARKCGKTSLLSALALYCMMADGEAGAEVDICAPSRDQSGICYTDACNYAESINKHGILQVLRSGIAFKHTKSKIKIMSSDAKFGDGWNTSVGIIDEYAAFSDNAVADLMTSSMGMRTQPLMFYITTAGFNLFGPCKEYRDMCADILRGEKEDDTIFPLIYELDEGDDWKDSAVWKKCCPSLGITVENTFMRDLVTKASNSPSLTNSILTKNLNKWCSSKSTWLSYDNLLAVSETVALKQFEGCSSFIGIDLASTCDLTCVSALIPYGDKYYFKTWTLLPEDSLDGNVNSFNYYQWKTRGFLETTPGNVTDYSRITDIINEINRVCPVQLIAYDSWNSTQEIIELTNLGYNCQPFSQSLGAYNRPTKAFERMTLCKQVVVDDNELVRWSFGNVSIRTDNNENTKPAKENVMSKIDPVIAMLTALGGYLEHPELCASSSIYVF